MRLSTLPIVGTPARNAATRAHPSTLSVTYTPAMQGCALVLESMGGYRPYDPENDDFGTISGVLMPTDPIAIEEGRFEVGQGGQFYVRDLGATFNMGDYTNNAQIMGGPEPAQDWEGNPVTSYILRLA